MVSPHAGLFFLHYLACAMNSECLRPPPHLWVLVVRWHGWPMSLKVEEEPGLKYSSAVSAAGFVTAGDDIWVTSAWNKINSN